MQYSCWWQCYFSVGVVLESPVLIYSDSSYLLNAYCASSTVLSTHTRPQPLVTLLTALPGRETVEAMFDR